MDQIKLNKKFRVIIFGFFLIIFLGLFTGPAFALENKYPTLPNPTSYHGPKGDLYKNGLNLEEAASGDLPGFVLYIFVFGLIISGAAAITMFIWAGIQWTTSVGDPKKQSDARDRITKAVIGLIVLLSSYVLLNVINPDLAKLSSKGGVGTKIDCLVFTTMANEKYAACQTKTEPEKTQCLNDAATFKTAMDAKTVDCNKCAAITNDETARSQCFASLSKVILKSEDVPDLKKLQAQTDINAKTKDLLTKFGGTDYLCTYAEGTSINLYECRGTPPLTCSINKNPFPKGSTDFYNASKQCVDAGGENADFQTFQNLPEDRYCCNFPTSITFKYGDQLVNFNQKPVGAIPLAYSVFGKKQGIYLISKEKQWFNNWTLYVKEQSPINNLNKTNPTLRYPEYTNKANGVWFNIDSLYINGPYDVKIWKEVNLSGDNYCFSDSTEEIWKQNLGGAQDWINKAKSMKILDDGACTK